MIYGDIPIIPLSQGKSRVSPRLLSPIRSLPPSIQLLNITIVKDVFGYTLGAFFRFNLYLIPSSVML